MTFTDKNCSTPCPACGKILECSHEELFASKGFSCACGERISFSKEQLSQMKKTLPLFSPKKKERTKAIKDLGIEP